MQRPAPGRGMRTAEHKPSGTAGRGAGQCPGGHRRRPEGRQTVTAVVPQWSEPAFLLSFVCVFRTVQKAEVLFLKDTGTGPFQRRSAGPGAAARGRARLTGLAGRGRCWGSVPGRDRGGGRGRVEVREHAAARRRSGPGPLGGPGMGRGLHGGGLRARGGGGAGRGWRRGWVPRPGPRGV